MADRHNLTDTPPSGSNLDEDGYRELQSAAIFENTMVVDSPLAETQMENLCFDTELVDNHDDLGEPEDVKVEPQLCEFNTEVVLDSEDDEGICNTKTESTTGRNERKAEQKSERQTPCLDSDSIDKQFVAVKRLSSTSVDRSDGDNSLPQLSEYHYVRRLDYMGSEEPHESSQANALCFVDNFLSCNAIDMCQVVEERTSSRKKSPLVSSAKGTQSLAKLINQGSSVREMGTFEWCETDKREDSDYFSKMMADSSEFRGFRQKAAIKVQNVKKKETTRLSNEHGEKKDLAEFQEDMRSDPHPPPNLMEQRLNVHVGIEQESERNLTDLTSGSIKELDQLMQAESSWDMFEASCTAREIPDTFDVGIGTQIAAEAMEALFYGPPFQTGDTYEGQENTLADLPAGETKNTSNLEQHSCQIIAAFASGDTTKQSTGRKRYARRYRKEVSHSSSNCNSYQELNYRIKPKPYKSKQSKVNKGVSLNNVEKCQNRVNPFVQDEQSLLMKKVSKEESVILQTRHLKVGANMRGTNDQPGKPTLKANNVKGGSMLTYKRKRKRVVADPPKLLSGEQKCSKLQTNASAKALDMEPSEEKKVNPQEAALARTLRSDIWNCPKRRRTHCNRPINSSGASNINVSCITVCAKEHNLHSVRSQKTPEDDETTSNNFNMNGQMFNASSQPSLGNTNSDVSLLRQNFYEQVTDNVANNDLAVTSSRISTQDLDKSEAIRTGKLDYMENILIINCLENHSFGSSFKKSIKPSGAECNSHRKSMNEASSSNICHVYYTRPRNKNVPKPPLVNELIGLRVPESVSDFTQKDFRARRNVADIRVLFSQHLDDDIIKQQKKISARLGISIASCAADATHFVADKFMRTGNMLEAIALGKPVVTHLWLDSCGQASCLLDEKMYILRDSKREKEIGFSMPVSLARARQYPLLKDKRVCFSPNVKPSKDMIISLVKAVGGKVMETSQILATKYQNIPDDLLILSCQEDIAICAPLLDKGAAIYGSELLLNGIVIQKLEYERHRLFVEFPRKKRPNSERNKLSRRSSKGRSLHL